MNFSSNATYSTVEYTELDQARWEKEAEDQFKKTTKDLNQALEYTDWRQLYQIWNDYFWEGDYEEYAPEMEFPEFVDNAEYYIEKELQRTIENHINE